jgi:hypothetical protein
VSMSHAAPLSNPRRNGKSCLLSRPSDSTKGRRLNGACDISPHFSVAKLHKIYQSAKFFSISWPKSYALTPQQPLLMVDIACKQRAKTAYSPSNLLVTTNCNISLWANECSWHSRGIEGHKLTIFIILLQKNLVV